MLCCCCCCVISDTKHIILSAHRQEVCMSMIVREASDQRHGPGFGPAQQDVPCLTNSSLSSQLVGFTRHYALPQRVATERTRPVRSW
jgi:hypothetical protein